MNYDNPAARLLMLLKQGKEKDPKQRCDKVWEHLLNAIGDRPTLMSRLGKVMELPQQTILALQECCPEQGDIWSHWEARVNAAFMVQNMHAPWETFINHIDDHTLTYLSMSSALLQAKANTKLIADSDLETIRAKLDEILNEVVVSSQPEEVRKYLVRNLRRIIVSIDEYRLTGALPLLDAIDTTLGHAHLDKQYYSFLKDTELGKQLLETLGAMANVVTVAVGIPQLSVAISALLGG